MVSGEISHDCEAVLEGLCVEVVVSELEGVEDLVEEESG
jgi:hypothetical protein